MNKLIQALVARALEAKTQTEVDTLCGDVDRLFQQERIKWQEHELLFRLIQRLYPYDGEKYKMKGVCE